MVTLHEVITFLVSMQISISSLQTHNVNRCGRSRHLARKLSLRRKRSSPNVFEMARSEERFSRNAETDLVCRLLLEKKKDEYIRVSNTIEKPNAKGTDVVYDRLFAHC